MFIINQLKCITECRLFRTHHSKLSQMHLSTYTGSQSCCSRRKPSYMHRPKRKSCVHRGTERQWFCSQASRLCVHIRAQKFSGWTGQRITFTSAARVLLLSKYIIHSLFSLYCWCENFFVDLTFVLLTESIKQPETSLPHRFPCWEPCLEIIRFELTWGASLYEKKIPLWRRWTRNHMVGLRSKD